MMDTIKIIWQKYKLPLICFFISIPLIVGGICAMHYFYKPQFEWQKTYKYLLEPIMIIVYCLIVETVLVLIPMFIMHKKTKKDKAATSTTLSTDNSQQKETQLPIV